MNVSLKSVKVNNALSQETLCFSASIYLDGKRIGTVSNAGHGGPNQYDWIDNTAGLKVDEWIVSEDSRGFGAYAIDCFYDELTQSVLAARDEKSQLRRWCKKQTLFSLEGDDAGSFRTINFPFCVEVKKHLVKKHGDKLVRIVNEEIK